MVKPIVTGVIVFLVYIFVQRRRREGMMSIEVFGDCECTDRIRRVALDDATKSLSAAGITTSAKQTDSNGFKYMGQVPWKCVKTRGVMGTVEYTYDNNKGGSFDLDPDGTTHATNGCHDGVSGRHLFVNWKRIE